MLECTTFFTRSTKRVDTFLPFIEQAGCTETTVELSASHVENEGFSLSTQEILGRWTEICERDPVDGAGGVDQRLVDNNTGRNLQPRAYSTQGFTRKARKVLVRRFNPVFYPPTRHVGETTRKLRTTSRRWGELRRRLGTSPCRRC